MKSRNTHYALLGMLSLLTVEGWAADTAKIQLQTDQPAATALLNKAYQTLQSGTIDEATGLYRQALEHAPQHPDILLTLAALAQHQGQNSAAARYRQEAAQAAPLDGNVQASLLANSGLDEALRESRLKQLSSQHEHSAIPHFVLGNLYAGQQRWPEAQAAYGKALGADPGNPDYLFNLAVSHEHLRQTRAARQCYRQAIAAAQQRRATFELAQAAARLKALNP